MATPTRTRVEMREYQRKRRARIKTEAWSAVGMAPPPALAKDALRAHAKARTWAAANLPSIAIGGRPAPLILSPPRDAPNAADTPPPPKSLYAVGGQPGRGLIPCGSGYPAPPDQFTASAYGQFMARTETMLAALAARNDAQERRIAALEKTVALNETAGRTARALARAIGGLVGVRLP